MSLRARREDNKCFQLVSVAWSHLRNHFAFTNQLAAKNNVVYHLCYVCYVFPVYAASVDLDKEFFVLCHDLHSIKNQEEYWLKEVEFEHKSCTGPRYVFFLNRQETCASGRRQQRALQVNCKFDVFTFLK